MEDGTYTGITTARDGSKIPLCGGKALHSSYSPVREAAQFAAQFAADGGTDGAPGRCFLVLGLAGGYHIAALLERFPRADIIVAEHSADAAGFLSEIPAVRALLADPRVSVADAAHLAQAILAVYKPAVHGALTPAPLRAWEAQFPRAAAAARAVMGGALRAVSADYSVQSHFGKLWQRNILENLRAEQSAPGGAGAQNVRGHAAAGRTAAIIAAGPTLNESAAIIAARRESYSVIATDTAYGALLAHGIAADAVVSVDGQMVSHEHFMHAAPERTAFVFDVCANPAAVRSARTQGRTAVLVETGHPLAQYASLSAGGALLHLDAGSGTVTVAAASFAIQMGFTRLQFFGADFSYTGGAPYARGTYLDARFHGGARRTCPAETAFTALLFRTETRKKSARAITTDVLDSYAASLAQFLSEHGFAREDGADSGIAPVHAAREGASMGARWHNPPAHGAGKPFPYRAFITRYARDLEESLGAALGGGGAGLGKLPPAQFHALCTAPAFLTLLPLAAYYARTQGTDGAGGTPPLVLAYSKTLGYTKTL